MGDPSFLGVTVQVSVPDFKAGLNFYSRLFGRPPEFEPYDDFAEWKAVKDVWFQLGEGEPRQRTLPAFGSTTSEQRSSGSSVSLGCDARLRGFQDSSHFATLPIHGGTISGSISVFGLTGPEFLVVVLTRT
jgi:hypothetical protein